MKHILITGADFLQNLIEEHIIVNEQFVKKFKQPPYLIKDIDFNLSDKNRFCCIDL